MLLEQSLQQVPTWTGTHDQKKTLGKQLAATIVPAADVERWKARGHTVRRGCYTQDGDVLLEVQITGPKGLKHIFLTRTASGLTGRIGTQDLNGSTPATAQDLIGLIDSLLTT